MHHLYVRHTKKCNEEKEAWLLKKNYEEWGARLLKKNDEELWRDYYKRMNFYEIFLSKAHYDFGKEPDVCMQTSESESLTTHQSTRKRLNELEV